MCLWMLLDTFTLWGKVVFFSAVSSLTETQMLWKWRVCRVVLDNNNNKNNTKREKRKSECATKATWLQDNKWLDFRKAGQLVSPCWSTGLGFLLFSCLHLFPPDIQTHFHASGKKKNPTYFAIRDGLNFTKESSNHRRCIRWHQWNIVA